MIGKYTLPHRPIAQAFHITKGTYKVTSHYSQVDYTIGKADRSTFTELWTESAHSKATIQNIWIYFFLKYTLKYVTLEERERKEKVYQYIHDKLFIRQGEKYGRIW